MLLWVRCSYACDTHVRQKLNEKRRKQQEVSKLGTITPGCLKANPAKESWPTLMLDTDFVSESPLFFRKTFQGS